MHDRSRFTGAPFWEPGTRVHITHDPDAGTVVANTTDAMAPALADHGLVPAGPRRWCLPDSTNRPVDYVVIDGLVDVLRRHHHVAVATRLHTRVA